MFHFPPHSGLNACFDDVERVYGSAYQDYVNGITSQMRKLKVDVNERDVALEVRACCGGCVCESVSTPVHVLCAIFNAYILDHFLLCVRSFQEREQELGTLRESADTKVHQQLSKENDVLAKENLVRRVETS